MDLNETILFFARQKYDFFIDKLWLIIDNSSVKKFFSTD